MGSPWRLVPSPPVARGLAVGAGDLLAVPVDGEPGKLEAALVTGLPATVRRQRTDQLDAVVGANGQDVVHAGVAGVDQVLIWQQIHADLAGVASGDGVDVGGGGDRRGDMDDQVGPVGLAGLGAGGPCSRGEPTPRLTP
jgi:hypothetical protein